MILQSLGTVTVEIQRHIIKLDPSINVYTVKTVARNGEWPETFGSRDELVAFVRGLKVALTLEGYQCSQLDAEMLHLHPAPAGVRFILSRDEMSRREELDDQGNVIRH